MVEIGASVLLFVPLTLTHSLYMHLSLSLCSVDTELQLHLSPWWRHQMEFAVLLALCAGNSRVPGEFPAQRPVARSFNVFFDLRPNKRLSKQWWGWWFETLSSPLWRHCNASIQNHTYSPMPAYAVKWYSFPPDWLAMVAGVCCRLASSKPFLPDRSHLNG